MFLNWGNKPCVGPPDILTGLFDPLCDVVPWLVSLELLFSGTRKSNCSRDSP